MGGIWRAYAWLLLLTACTAPRDARQVRSDTVSLGTPTAPIARHLDSLLALGDSLVRQSPDSARIVWQRALEGAVVNNDSAAESRALTGMSRAARLQGDYAAARTLGERGLALARHLGMKDELFRAQNSLGLLAWAEKRFEEADSLFAQATAAAREVGDSVGVAKALSNSGLVLQELASFERSRVALETARDRLRVLGDTVNLAHAMINLAALDVAVGEPASALVRLGEARVLLAATDDSIGEMNARAQLATAYHALGEPRKAFAALDSALDLAHRQGARAEESEDLGILGDMFHAAGDDAHALDQYARAAALNDTLGRTEQRGILLRNEAKVYLSLGNPRLAYRRATDALRTHRAAELPLEQLSDLLVLAEGAQQLGHPAEAQANISKARALAASLDAEVARVQVALTEARIAASARDWQRVLAVLRNVRSLLPLAGYESVAEEASLRARAHAGLNELPAAANAGAQALTATERIRERYGSGELRTSYATSRAAIYAQQTLLLLRMGRTAEAFAVADAARGRAILEHLADARVDVQRQGGTSTAGANLLLRRIDALVARLREREATAPRERSPAVVATTKDLRDSLLAARAEYEALMARASFSSRDETTRIAASRVPVADVQSALNREEALLEYFVTNDRLLIFVVTRDSLRLVEQGVRGDSLASRVRFARALLGDRSASERAKPALVRLHAELIAPVARAGSLSGIRTLVIVPHGVLAYLPFAALVDATSKRYLVQDYAVLVAPTAATMPALRRVAARVPQPARALPTTVLAPFAKQLPGSRDEVRRISDVRAQTQSFVGEAATEGKLRASLNTGGTIHIATHAVMNAQNPLFSRIELARGPARESSDDGRLEVHEILRLRFTAPLVFLSGCETAIGGSWSTLFDHSEDFTTMAQAWLYAGARNVVATLWRIDDIAAAEFSQHFYRAIKGGSVADALAQAQREMIADPNLKSPYLWASYQLLGEGRGDEIPNSKAKTMSASVER